MRIPRLYEPAAAAAATVTLNADAARHATQVLRLKPGAALILFDGEGDAFKAVLDSLEPPRARIVEPIEADAESPLDITLLQALSRGAKMDMVVQKAAELGARAIVPVITERSVMRLNAGAAEKKRARWQSVAISACEQCGRNRVPAVHAPSSLNSVLEISDPSPTVNLLLDPAGRSGLPDAAPSAARVLIGPEGGLTPTERQATLAAGYMPVKLGPRVLRTETAALATLAVLQYVWGDLGALS